MSRHRRTKRGMEWCDDLLEHKPSVWFAVYTTEEVWGWSKVWPGGLIVAWLGSQAQHHRWRLEVAYFPWKTPTSISRRHSGAHTALPKSGTWWWRLCGHINEAVLGLAGPVATSVTCMWKSVKLWRTAAINLSQPVAWLDSCNALPRAWSVQLVPRWNTWPGTGTWDCCGAYCFRMAWQGLAASCITLLAQHMPVGGSHRAGLRKSKDAKKKRKSHIISEEGQKADDETYSSEDRLVDFINKAVLIVATQDFTNQLPLPPLPEDPPAEAEPVADPDLQPQPTKEGEGEEAAQMVTSPPTQALEILSRIHWVLDPLDTIQIQPVSQEIFKDGKNLWELCTSTELHTLWHVVKSCAFAIFCIVQRCGSFVCPAATTNQRAQAPATVSLRSALPSWCGSSNSIGFGKLSEILTKHDFH